MIDTENITSSSLPRRPDSMTRRQSFPVIVGGAAEIASGALPDHLRQAGKFFINEVGGQSPASPGADNPAAPDLGQGEDGDEHKTGGDGHETAPFYHTINDTSAYGVAGLFGSFVAGNIVGFDFSKLSAGTMIAANVARIGALKVGAAQAENAGDHHEAEHLQHVAGHETQELVTGVVATAVLAILAEMTEFIQFNEELVISDQELDQYMPILAEDDLEYFRTVSQNPELTEEELLAEVNDINDDRLIVEIITNSAEGEVDTGLARLERIVGKKYARELAVKLGLESGGAGWLTTYFSMAHSNTDQGKFEEYSLTHKLELIRQVRAEFAKEGEIADLVNLRAKALQTTKKHHDARLSLEMFDSGNQVGEKLVGDPPQVYQVITNVTAPEKNLAVIPIWNLYGYATSEASMLVANMSFLNSLGLKGYASEFLKVYTRSQMKAFKEIGSALLAKVPIAARDIMEDYFDTEMPLLKAERKRAAFIRDQIVPKLQKEQRRHHRTKSRSKADAGIDLTEVRDSLDHAMTQDVILLNIPTVLYKMFDQLSFGLGPKLAEKFIRGNDGEISLEEMQAMVTEMAVRKSELLRGGIDLQDSFFQDHAATLKALLDKLSVRSIQDLIQRLATGETKTILEVGQIITGLAKEETVGRFAKVFKEYYGNFSADNSQEGHEDVGFDVEHEIEELESVTLFGEQDLATLLMERDITATSVGDDTLAKALRAIMKSQHSGQANTRFGDLVNMLGTIEPEKAIRLISDSVREAAGPQWETKLSHKTKEVIFALLTQIPAVGSLVHLSQEALAGIEDPTLKQNTIFGLGIIMSSFADNVAAYLFVRQMLVDLKKEQYNPDVFVNNPRFIIGVDMSAIGIGEDAGAGSMIGNGPVVSQKEVDAQMSQDGLITMRTKKRNLGKSVVTNRSFFRNLPLVFIKANAAVAAFTPRAA